jgi:hypothetical protein
MDELIPKMLKAMHQDNIDEGLYPADREHYQR